jgi:ribonucleoside-diphosphate reductase alpha chain
MSRIPLSSGAVRILRERYILRSPSGMPKETPEQMFRRVARAIFMPEKKWKHPDKIDEKFYRMMVRLEFLPNSPALMNAGTFTGQLSACYVIPVGDSMPEIFDALKAMAIIHQNGGGTGFSFSRLRPAGSHLVSSGGRASGPVSFMKLFDTTTDIVKQGGRRRGANMGVLSATHPDILNFITSKSDMTSLQNFNISVAASDTFMEAARTGSSYNLIDPRTGRPAGKENAEKVLDAVAENAWKTGDPGMIFIDEINRKHLVPGKVECLNTCGEAVLLPWESCNLGSINIAKMLKDRTVNWELLEETVHLAVRFLDNAIDANVFPLEQAAAVSRMNRKIGLGIMGFADALIEMGIPYASDDAVSFAGRLMSFIQKEARVASEALGKERGSFPNFGRSRLTEKYRHMRNAACTAIAPTGTISMIAACSSGIEPLFALSFTRAVLGGFSEINPAFEDFAKRRGFHSQGLMDEVMHKGSLSNIGRAPVHARKLFATAYEIRPKWHVKMQAEFQKHTDQAVSKTVNLPRNAAIEDIKNVFILAHRLKCKGITVYRDSSRAVQVLNAGACRECPPV